MKVIKPFDPGWVKFEPWYNEDMDETLIRLIRDNIPKMLAQDICGVDKMLAQDICGDLSWIDAHSS